MGEKYLKKSIILIILLIISISILVVKYDPFQQFRINEYGYGDQRNLSPGIAKNYNYNLVVLGTSTSENILKKDLEELYKKKSINLSLSGSTSYEHRRLLELILKKKPKIVIYGLDVFSYNREINATRVPIDEFLYTESRLDKFKYIFNLKVIEGVVKGLFSKNEKNWLDTFGFLKSKQIYSEKNSLDFSKGTVWGEQNIGAINGMKKGYDIDKMKQNFDKFLMLAEQNKEIEYRIYLPPYSIFWWYFIDKYNCLKEISEFKEYISKKVLIQKNIKLYDFQNRRDIISNMDNYRDITHYSPNINKKIIEMIKEEEGLVKSSINVQEEIKKMKEFILPLEEKYDLKNIEI